MKKASITDVCLGYKYAYGSSAKELKVAGACLCEKDYDRSLVKKKKQLIIGISQILFYKWKRWLENFCEFQRETLSVSYSVVDLQFHT